MADFILDVASGAVTSSKLEADAAANHLIACSERCASFCFQAGSIIATRARLIVALRMFLPCSLQVAVRTHLLPMHL